MPDILFVSGEYPPDAGGVGDYTARLRSALKQRGVGSRVLTRVQPSRQSEEGTLREVRAWNVQALGRIAKRAAPDGIVHIQYQPAAFDLRGEICLAPLWLRQRRPDVRTITTFHDVRVPYLFPKAGPLRLGAVRLLARTSHANLASDPADLLRLGGSSNRQHVVPIGSNVACEPPPGYDRAAFRHGLGIDPSDPVIAYFGFLNASKGLDALLQTFASVRASAPGARLLLLGGPASASDITDRLTAKRLEHWLGELGLGNVESPCVTAPGWLPGPELSANLLAADVALLPYADGASARRGSLLACATHSLPIVTTIGPGLLPPLLGRVRACPPGDADSLTSAVLNVLGNSAERARLAAGSAAITAATGWDAIAERHRQIYGL